MIDRNDSRWQPRRVAIIGVGLLGGSLALAIRKAWPSTSIFGTSRSPDTRSHIVSTAMVDRAFANVDGWVAECDLIVIASPVRHIATTIPVIAAQMAEAAILTDVGSTKAEIVAAAEADQQAVSRFVGSHPIAGSEKTGPENAIANLFEEKLTITTPTHLTNREKHASVQAFWRSLGCRVVEMRPQEHDAALAAASHMPHVVAAALAHALPIEYAPVVGTGFRDATRIAAGDPKMWRDILEANAAPTLQEINRFISVLDQYRQCIDQKDWDGVEDLLRKAKETKAKTMV